MRAPDAVLYEDDDAEPVDAYAETLGANGYVVIRQALDRACIGRLNADLGPRFARTPFCEGDFYGHKTKRFGRLLTRSRAAIDLALHPVALALAERVLSPHCDVMLLNLMQALELHPGQVAQPPHRDEDMWRGPKGKIEYLINVMWPLTPYREENGGTVIWPHSHQQHLSGAVVGNPISPELAPGDALVFLGSTLHGGGANRSRLPRRGIIVSYCLGWLMPYENPWLAYPPEVARHFPKTLSRLIGYRQHRPNIGNFDGQCPSILLEAGPPPDYLAAVDALAPEQALALRRQTEPRSGD